MNRGRTESTTISRLRSRHFRYFLEKPVKYRKPVILLELSYRNEITLVSSAWIVGFKSQIRLIGIFIKIPVNIENRYYNEITHILLHLKAEVSNFIWNFTLFFNRRFKNRRTGNFVRIELLIRNSKNKRSPNSKFGNSESEYKKRVAGFCWKYR